MTDATGSAPQPVVISTEKPVGTRTALRVVAAPQATNLQVAGGPAQPIYVVSQAEIESGTYVMSGNIAAFPMTAVSDGRAVQGQRPIPVVVVSGSFTNTPPAPELLALDSFTDANGVALTAHTPNVGPMWSAVHGTFDIQGGQANTTAINGTSGVANATVNVGRADVLIQALARFPSGGSAGLTARLTDGTNYWTVRFNAGSFALFEIVAGTPTSRASAVISASINTLYEITMRCTGTAITATWRLPGGSLTTIQYASATFNQAATQHGLRAGAVGVRYDDFSVVPG